MCHDSRIYLGYWEMENLPQLADRFEAEDTLPHLKNHTLDLEIFFEYPVYSLQKAHRVR